MKATYAGRTIDELRALIPNPHRPPLLESERGRVAKALREAGEGVLANDVANKLWDLWKLYDALPTLLDAVAIPLSVVEQLRKCAKQLHFYEDQHLAKTPPDYEKAKTNRILAEDCDKVLRDYDAAPSAAACCKGLAPAAECRCEIERLAVAPASRDVVPVWVGVDSQGNIHKTTVASEISGCRIECAQLMQAEGDVVLVPRRAFLSFDTPSPAMEAT